MIRRPPRSTQSRSSAASDVYKRQPVGVLFDDLGGLELLESAAEQRPREPGIASDELVVAIRAGEQIADDVDRPTVAEQISGSRDRAVLTVGRHEPWSHGSVLELPRRPGSDLREERELVATKPPGARPCQPNRGPMRITKNDIP